MSTGRATVKASKLPLTHVFVLASHLQAAQDSIMISSKSIGCNALTSQLYLRAWCACCSSQFI
jgi:hypothetical protein